MLKDIIILGGQSTERLYLKRDRFKYNGKIVEVYPTYYPNVNMGNLITRHIARYYLVGLFLRPNMSWLDFPCGSGYASELFDNVHYYGADKDEITIKYANRNYKRGFFVAQELELTEIMDPGQP